MDDRDRERPGAKFADAELLGFPVRIVIGDRGLANGTIEVIMRSTGESVEVPVDEVAQYVLDALG